MSAIHVIKVKAITLNTDNNVQHHDRHLEPLETTYSNLIALKMNCEFSSKKLYTQYWAVILAAVCAPCVPHLSNS